MKKLWWQKQRTPKVFPHPFPDGKRTRRAKLDAAARRARLRREFIAEGGDPDGA